VPSTRISSPGEPLAFEFTWDQAEHARLVRAVTRHQLTGWLRRSALGLIFGALALFLLVVPLLRPGADPWIMWRAAAPWIVALGVWYHEHHRAVERHPRRGRNGAPA
jgi:hypothetical protein